MTSRRFERSGIVFLAAALCAACQTLPAIPLSTCGNGVIESAHGEDCDLVAGGPTFLCGASDAGAKACRFLWDPDHTCPPGFGAGGDGICHRPSGAFTQAQRQVGEDFRSAANDRRARIHGGIPGDHADLLRPEDMA